MIPNYPLLFFPWVQWAINSNCKVPNFLESRVNHKDIRKWNNYFAVVLSPAVTGKSNRGLLCRATHASMVEDSWKKKCILWIVITMGRCMRDFWTRQHVPETWHRFLFAPGLASSREWEEAKLLRLVLQCAQFEIHQKPRYTRETFINHTRAAVRQEIMITHCLV